MSGRGRRHVGRGAGAGAESAPRVTGQEASAAAGHGREFPVAAATGFGAVIALLMGGALIHGVTAGNLVEEGELLLALAWGRVTMIEVYAGFALFAAWIWQREPRARVAVAWIVALLLLGNLAAGCYVILAARGCRGNASRFWRGPRLLADETA